MQSEHVAPVAPAARWDRSRRLEWFDADRAAAGRALVVGAGALGNEVAKNLALSGVGHLAIVDPDRVEVSNLNRCVYFTQADAAARRHKAEVLAQRVAEAVPEATVEALSMRIESVDAGAFAGADVVVSCVDNVAARLHANAHARHAGTALVDGGTHELRGRVQVVGVAEDACLECGMNRSHRRTLQQRYACSGREASVFVPPLAQEITTTSVIAAIQAREALKIILGRVDERQRGVLHYDGRRNRFDILAAGRDPACPHHSEVKA